MISIENIRINKEKYKNMVLNKNLTSYIDSILEYEFSNDIDFSEFITVLETESDKNICNPILRKYKSLGKEIPKPSFYDKFEDYNDFYDYKKRTPAHQKAIDKNNNLIEQLEDFRTEALGIGTNKLKRRLNKLALTDDIAKAIRYAIEAEDKSIQAKKAYGKFRDKIYQSKKEYIFKLIDLFYLNNWNFGKQKSNVKDTNNIVFFEIPCCEQISFHTDLYGEYNNIPIYEKEWDGKINSTYPKLLDSIEKYYFEILK